MPSGLLERTSAMEEATWELAHSIKTRFPSFCLEDKADFREGDIDRNLSQTFKVYFHRPKRANAS